MTAVIERGKDKADRWCRWAMVNIRPERTGLSGYIHCYQGILRHAARIKIQLATDPPNVDNSVSVAIHDPDIVNGRKKLVAAFKDSARHTLVKEFINKNRQLLLDHAMRKIDDEDLINRIEKI